MVDVLAELRAEIMAFVARKQSLGGLRDWLTDCADEVADSPHREVHDLAGQAWILLSEHDAGDRNEASVRTALAARSRAPSPAR